MCSSDLSSLREAKIKLRSQGLFVSTIAEEAHGIAHPLRDLSIKGLLGRVRMEDLAVTTRQLSTLVGASIPLVDALGALFEQTDSPAMQTPIAQVRD